ncbi:MAG TPA: DUF3187 family protein [Geobacteraceae bacterium]
MIPLSSRFRLLLLCVAPCLGSALFAASATALEIEPFATFNQSPIVQIYGLPAAGSPTVVPAGRIATELTLDIASNFAIDTADHESITLDAEEWRTNVALRYGLGRDLEVGLDIPVLTQWGGILDAPIEGWHDFFGIEQGGRNSVPHGRTILTYSRAGEQRINVTRENAGIGDIRLTGAWQLYRDADDPRRAIALRSNLKFPTGDSSRLHGSGGVDFALWLSGREAIPLFPKSWAALWSAGGMLVSQGDILPELQRNLAGFASLGIGWQPGEAFNLKAFTNLNTPFYQHSALRELSATSVQLVAGGTIAITRTTSLDISFSEDLPVLTTSPDFGYTFTLRTLW